MLLSIAVALSLTHSATALTVTIPFHSEENLVIIKVFVDGRPASLILDTGAESTFLTPEAVGMTNTVGVSRFQSNAQTAKSVSRNASISLTENGSTFNQPVIVVHLTDLSKRIGTKCDGILGQDFLRHFRTFMIDYKSQTVAFTR